MPKTVVYPCVSVPRELREAYARCPGLPPLSTLLADAMRATLLEAGVTAPPPVAPGRTAKAAAARWKR